MEIEETKVCKYVDSYGIFTEQVDIDALHDIILYDFIPCLTQSNFWFAVWCVLKDNNCLKMDVWRSDFGKQMVEWFGKTFSKNCLDAYAATSLSYTKWEDWDEAFFQKFKERHKVAIKKGRISINTAKKIYYLCERFNPIVIKKCIKNNVLI